MSKDETLQAIDGLRQELAEIRRALTERASGDDPTKERAFNQLYDELKAYKEDWQYQAEKPLLLDLLLFYDSLNWFQESLVKQEMSREVVADSFQYLIDEFVELLYRRDVNPMPESTAFDRKRHKAVQVVDTDNAALDQTIHQVLKRGFFRGDRVLRPEEIVVRRHRGQDK